MAILDFLKNFRSSVDTIRNEIAATQDELELARRSREDLQQLPETKAEIIEVLYEQARVDGEKYVGRLRNSVDKLFRDRDPVTGMPKPGWDGTPINVFAVSDTGKRPSVADIEGCLAFYLKDDVIRAGIARAVDAMRAWDAGPPRAERVAEIGRLDRKIAEMEARLREIAANATEVAISIGTLSPPKKQGDGRKLVGSLGAVYRDRSGK